MTERHFFRVTFVRPDGWQYETTGRASNEAEAVRLADEHLEYVERIGISDFLTPDGVTVAPPARLTVERVSADLAGSGFGLVITDSNGNVTRK
jgi:hypothetical protein